MAKKKKEEEEKENGERWLVSYADFMTLLLALFIILYAMASSDATSAGSDGSGQNAALAAIARAFGNDSILEFSGDTIIDMDSNGGELTEEGIEAKNLDAVRDAVEDMSAFMGLMEDSIEVVIDEIGLHIRIKDAVLFSSGSATINADAQPIMIRLGEILKNLPNNYIQIEGHTDNIPMGGNPNIPTNWELGSLRAVNVLKMLVEKAALNPKYLSAISYGEFKPVDTNTTAVGRANNRRVEITILRNYEISEN